MALAMTEHLYEFLARVGTGSEAAGRVVGMQVTYIDRVLDSLGTVVLERTGRTEAVDWDGLVALMHEDDVGAQLDAIARSANVAIFVAAMSNEGQDALKAALDAAVALR